MFESHVATIANGAGQKITTLEAKGRLDRIEDGLPSSEELAIRSAHSQGMTGPEIARMLYHDSGLKGLSGISHDMRTLLASDDPNAAQAVDYYVFRIRRELGAMAAVLGGLDAVVFCGGIGENAAPIRARVIEGMGFLGLTLDAAANAANATDIGTGSTEILVIRTDEERVIARAVARALG